MFTKKENIAEAFEYFGNSRKYYGHSLKKFIPLSTLLVFMNPTEEQIEEATKLASSLEALHNRAKSPVKWDKAVTRNFTLSCLLFNFNTEEITESYYESLIENIEHSKIYPKNTHISHVVNLTRKKLYDYAKESKPELFK